MMMMAMEHRIDPTATVDATAFVDPLATLEANVSVGPFCLIEGPAVLKQGVVLASHVVVQGAVVLEPQVWVGPFSQLHGPLTVGQGTRIQQSLLINSSVGPHCSVGPFAHLRQHSAIGPHCRIGNFVEVKQSTVGAHTNAAHLSYLGDAQLGEHVNVGAGTITANYNSLTGAKQACVVEDHVSLGANSVLVAPLTVGEGAMVAAGSTVTQNIAAGALAIARAPESQKLGWVAAKQHKA
jgi:bifunctional UDP-N-acetylglucosamine pyrophosphorylase/glucosamine-1-phosphate N-acetyltransferase